MCNRNGSSTEHNQTALDTNCAAQSYCINWAQSDCTGHKLCSTKLLHQLSTIRLHRICEENFSEIRKNVFHKTCTILALETARGFTAYLVTEQAVDWVLFRSWAGVIVSGVVWQLTLCAVLGYVVCVCVCVCGVSVRRRWRMRRTMCAGGVKPTQYCAYRKASGSIALRWV